MDLFEPKGYNMPNEQLHEFIVKYWNKLARFYHITPEIVKYFNIQYNDKMDFWGCIRAYGWWNEDNDKFVWEQLWLDIKPSITIEYFNKKEFDNIKRLLLHEMCHVIQYERFGFTPVKYHDPMFYLIGNEFNPNFYIEDTKDRIIIAHSTENYGKFTQQEWELEFQAARFLYTHKRFLKLGRQLRDVRQKQDNTSRKAIQSQINTIRSKIRSKFLNGTKGKVLKTKIVNSLSDYEKKVLLEQKNDRQNRRQMNLLYKQCEQSFNEYLQLPANTQRLKELDKEYDKIDNKYDKGLQKINGHTTLGTNQLWDLKLRMQQLRDDKDQFRQDCWDIFEIQYRKDHQKEFEVFGIDIPTHHYGGAKMRIKEETPQPSEALTS